MTGNQENNTFIIGYNEDKHLLIYSSGPIHRKLEYAKDKWIESILDKFSKINGRSNVQ